MKIIKNILIGLGAIFASIIVFAIVMFSESTDFKDKHEKFIAEFTYAFSQNWSVKNVSPSLTNNFISQINTPNGEQALGVFKAYGKLIELSDLEIQNYSTQNGDTFVGIFRFKGNFENGIALITISIREFNEIAQVDSFHLEPIGAAPIQLKVKT